MRTIQIGGNNSEPPAFRSLQALSVRQFTETAVTQVQVEPVRLGRISQRAAARLNAFVARLINGLAAKIVHRIKIRPAVLIQIGQHAARSPAARPGSRCGGHIGKRAVAVVVIELVAADVSHVQIGKPVIVKVAGRHPLTVADVPQSRRLRHVRKPPVDR